MSNSEDLERRGEVLLAERRKQRRDRLATLETLQSKAQEAKVAICRLYDTQFTPLSSQLQRLFLESDRKHYETLLAEQTRKTSGISSGNHENDLLGEFLSSLEEAATKEEDVSMALLKEIPLESEPGRESTGISRNSINGNHSENGAPSNSIAEPSIESKRTAGDDSSHATICWQVALAESVLQKTLSVPDGEACVSPSVSHNWTFHFQNDSLQDIYDAFQKYERIHGRNDAKPAFHLSPERKSLEACKNEALHLQEQIRELEDIRREAADRAVETVEELVMSENQMEETLHRCNELIEQERVYRSSQSLPIASSSLLSPSFQPPKPLDIFRSISQLNARGDTNDGLTLANVLIRTVEPDHSSNKSSSSSSSANGGDDSVSKLLREEFDTLNAREGRGAPTHSTAVFIHASVSMLTALSDMQNSIRRDLAYYATSGAAEDADRPKTMKEREQELGEATSEAVKRLHMCEQKALFLSESRERVAIINVQEEHERSQVYESMVSISCHSTEQELTAQFERLKSRIEERHKSSVQRHSNLQRDLEGVAIELNARGGKEQEERETSEGAAQIVEEKIEQDSLEARAKRATETIQREADLLQQKSRQLTSSVFHDRDAMRSSGSGSIRRDVLSFAGAAATEDAKEEVSAQTKSSTTEFLSTDEICAVDEKAVKKLQESLVAQRAALQDTVVKISSEVGLREAIREAEPPQYDVSNSVEEAAALNVMSQRLGELLTTWSPQQEQEEEEEGDVSSERKDAPVVSWTSGLASREDVEVYVERMRLERFIQALVDALSNVEDVNCDVAAYRRLIDRASTAMRSNAPGSNGARKDEEQSDDHHRREEQASKDLGNGATLEECDLIFEKLCAELSQLQEAEERAASERTALQTLAEQSEALNDALRTKLLEQDDPLSFSTI